MRCAHCNFTMFPLYQHKVLRANEPSDHHHRCYPSQPVSEWNDFQEHFPINRPANAPDSFRPIIDGGAERANHEGNYLLYAIIIKASVTAAHCRRVVNKHDLLVLDDLPSLIIRIGGFPKFNCMRRKLEEVN